MNAINPKPFLAEMLNKDVIVKLKWDIEYKGRLMAFDTYMNIQLADTEEYFDSSCKGFLGEILIRCNNILFIKEAN